MAPRRRHRQPQPPRRLRWDSNGLWVGIEWVVRPNETIIYVDGVEKYRVPADFSEIHKPFAVEAHGGTLWLKSISVAH
jgi:hypothetical protein